MNSKPSLEDRIIGSTLGAAVGDALGAPTECWDYRQVRERLGDYRGFEDLREALKRAGNPGFAWQYGHENLGVITDDTVLADVLLDCILEHDGQVDAHRFAKAWERFDQPVPNPDGPPVVRIGLMHFIEQIPLLRNRLPEIPKRELGHGEANATNAVMYIGSVGLLNAGDPCSAALMAADLTAVNQHGRPRDVAAGYAAAIAACFKPNATVEDVVAAGLDWTGDVLHCKEMRAMVDVARTCHDGEEYIERYYREIIGPLIPYRDLQSASDTSLCVSWNSAEILGCALAGLVITKGEDPRAMMLMTARIGRDCDTICRAAGGLIGAWGGLGAIPADWVELVEQRNRWLQLRAKAHCLAALVHRRLEQQRALAEHLLAQSLARE